MGELFLLLPSGCTFSHLFTPIWMYDSETLPLYLGSHSGAIYLLKLSWLCPLGAPSLSFQVTLTYSTVVCGIFIVIV